MHTSMPYDPLADFVHIALIGVFPQFFIVRSDYPAKSLSEMLAIVKAKPGTINYASAGVGTSGFLSGELLKQTGKYDMTHVPYKGPAPAIADLLGGRLDMVITANAAELARSGKVRILATTGQRRSKDYPDVPTVNEVVPGVVAVSWMGISAPAKTPRDVIERLQTEILAIAREEGFQARSADPAIGMAPLPLESDKFVGFIQNEIRTWTPVIKTGNIKVN
jgi:tripartite-type tricarboxylate transporter receptor subunit TctC